MFDRNETDFLVVGAGPVGLFSALRLRQAGHSVRIIDRGIFPSRESFALALHPATLEILDRMGLFYEAIDRGRSLHRVVYHEGGRLHLTVFLAMLGNRMPFAVVLPQSNLEEILLRKLGELGVKVEWNRELTDLRQDDTGVAVTIAKIGEVAQGYAVAGSVRVPRSEYESRARYVIGADGAHSTTRRLLHINTRPYSRPREFVLFELDSEVEVPDDLRVEFTPEGTNVLWPMPNRRCRWTFEVPADSGGPLNIAQFHRLLAERAPWFAPAPEKIRWAGRVNFTPTLAEHMGDDRVWLAGDAYHVTLPFGVHSMNAGIQEADLLVEALSRRSRGEDNGRGMELLEARRHSEWEWLLRADAGEGADPWMNTHAQDIRAALPATGDHLRILMEQVNQQLGIQRA